MVKKSLNWKWKAALVLSAALCMGIILGNSIPAAYAYFTTYAVAKGGYRLDAVSKTSIEESFSGWVKHVRISNEEGSTPVYVRARAYAGDSITLDYSGTGWSLKEDGWYYYEDIVEGGASTEELMVQISGVPEASALDEGASFNVVVVYEDTPVLYGEDGSPYADWDALLTEGEVEHAEE